VSNFTDLFLLHVQGSNFKCIANMVYHGSSSALSSRKLLVASIALLSSVVASPVAGNQRQRMYRGFSSRIIILTFQQSMAFTGVEHTTRGPLPSQETGPLRYLLAGKTTVYAKPRLARPSRNLSLLVGRRTTLLWTHALISPLTRVEIGGTRTTSELTSQVS
jgi:hypothetical protein